MSGAREQVARLLALVPYIQARREVSLEEAASDFAVSPAQIVKDLNVLWFCGLPGLGMGDLIDVDMEALEEGGVIRVSNADYLRRPLRLDSSEASALIVASRALREGSDDDVRPIVDSALGKLEAAAGDGAALAAQVDVRLPRQQARVSHLTELLTEAVERQRQVRLEYYVPTRDESTERVVDPLRVPPATATPTSMPTATSPRTSGCSGSTESRAPRCSTRRSTGLRTSSRATWQTASSSPRTTTFCDRRPPAAGEVGRGVLPGRGRSRAPRWRPHGADAGG